MINYNIKDIINNKYWRNKYKLVVKEVNRHAHTYNTDHFNFGMHKYEEHQFFIKKKNSVCMYYYINIPSNTHFSNYTFIHDNSSLKKPVVYCCHKRMHKHDPTNIIVKYKEMSLHENQIIDLA